MLAHNALFTIPMHITSLCSLQCTPQSFVSQGRSLGSALWLVPVQSGSIRAKRDKVESKDASILSCGELPHKVRLFVSHLVTS